MATPSSSDEFPFPFTPYSIQVDFMKALYGVLEDGCFGIFESPTGTGKSLSLICGVLKWLKDHQRKEEDRIRELLSDSSSCLGSSSNAQTVLPPTDRNMDEPDWLKEYDEVKAKRDEVTKAKLLLERKSKQTQQLQDARKMWKRVRDSNKRKADALRSENTVSEEEGMMRSDSQDDPDKDIVVDEYNSDKEEDTYKESGLSDDELCLEEEDDGCKIYYCSRTHSQLSQFVQEVKKSPYGNGTRVISLASRQNMCINEQVRRLGSNQFINDRCLELQRQKKEGTSASVHGVPAKKRKKSKSSGCPYYKGELLDSFRDLALSEVQDIEQLVSLGRDLKACSYYGSRRAVPEAELVVVPYNTLLHASTRRAVGIKLKGNIVIVDEAHNLLDTICNIHSVEINGAQVAKAHSQLSQYKDRYKERLKAKNLMYITQILQVLKSFLNTLKRGLPPECTSGEVKTLYKLNDFLFHLGIDNLNMFKILKYCEISKISRKLNGFVDKYFETVTLTPSTDGKANGGMDKDTAHRDGIPVHQQRSSPLMVIEAFLSALTNMDDNSRVSVTLAGQFATSSFRFLLLNPTVHFEEIVRECRAVVVAGGTMQPVSEFKDQLFGSLGVPEQRIKEFSCGHVIPEDNLLAVCLGRGPSGVQFDFTFKTRDSPEQISELGRTLVNLCNIVPAGVVCFFPSYEHEKYVYSQWEQSGTIDCISRKKQIFREPKISSQLDHVLAQYARCVKSNVGNTTGLSGALLLSVVGGKMSEGINFSNDLGRCVVMVGLPYPNVKSPELEEKMRYLDRTVKVNSQGLSGGQVHYENLCMKAVNQSIGRAIRHSNDYATVVLIDHRYSRKSVKENLPKWMTKSLMDANSFGVAYAAIRKVDLGCTYCSFLYMQYRPDVTRGTQHAVMTPPSIHCVDILDAVNLCT